VLTIDVSADAAEQLAKRVSFVEGMIFQMTLALNNLRLRLSLSDQALTDPLTAVGNRRRAAEALDAAYGACLEDKQSFALLMADIDLFKQVNDTFGHDVGDRVLKQVASTLTASIRESDVVARVGGEEFLIVLRNISAADAERVAEQIRSRVELCEGENLPKCTISIGLLHVADCFTDLEALTPLVDSALYRAKSTGRNRVSVVPNSATDSKLRNAAAETVDSAGPGELKGKSVAP
jgi:diguanylate cyclase (GGDEF)-like protein